jgi:hypothetical protein
MFALFKSSKETDAPQLFVIRRSANLFKTLMSVDWFTLKNDDFQIRQHLTCFLYEVAVFWHNLFNNTHRWQLNSLINNNTENVRKTSSISVKGGKKCLSHCEELWFRGHLHHGLTDERPYKRRDRSWDAFSTQLTVSTEICCRLKNNHTPVMRRSIIHSVFLYA